MKRVAKFSKVSFEQFLEGWKDSFGGTDEEIRAIYDDIILPRRATSGSAGYDIFSPVDFTLEPNKTLKMPTGVRCEINDGWVLKIYPRSGLGFKFRLQLNNTVGIIDSDYFYSDNEGHIFIKITNDTNENRTVELKKGTGFAQGIGFGQIEIGHDDLGAPLLYFHGAAAQCFRERGAQRALLSISHERNYAVACVVLDG